MERFSKVQTDKYTQSQVDHEFLHKGKFLNLIKYNDYEMVQEHDCVVILPFLRDEGVLIMRNEYVPTYKFRNKTHPVLKDTTNYLTVITGQIEEGETVENTIRRELYEEAGLLLTNHCELHIEGPLHISKSNASCYYLCLLELGINEYKFTKPVGDGSNNEKKSQTIRIDAGCIDDIRRFDLITQYLLEKFRNEFMK